MLDILISKALTYGRVTLLSLAALLLFVISRRIESTCGKPAIFFPVVLIISAFCLLIVLLTAYLQIQPTVSITS
jgi:hypothetical protein